MRAGLDIGGANIKLWREDGTGHLCPFPVWKTPQDLQPRLESLLKSFQILGPIAVTMTAELCDCFSSKEEGVRFILNSIPIPYKSTALFYTAQSKFTSLELALQNPLPCAAVNWLALANYLANQHPKGTGILLDMGSTTTDLIPIHQGKPINKGFTDYTRLQALELVYSGMRRTPLGPLLGQKYAQEWFSTTADAHLLLGNLSEAPDNLDTADGKPFTTAASSQRLARMLCADKENLQTNELLKIASTAIAEQTRWILKALETQLLAMPRAPEWYYLCGEGESFLQSILQSKYPTSKVILFSEQFGNNASINACAFSVFQLARANSWVSK